MGQPKGKEPFITDWAEYRRWSEDQLGGRHGRVAGKSSQWRQGGLPMCVSSLGPVCI